MQDRSLELVLPAALGLLESDRKDLLKCRLGEAQNPLLTRGFFQRGSHGLVVEPARPGLPEASRCFDRVGRGADRSLTMGAAAPSRATAHRPSLVPQSAPALARGVCHIRTVPSAQTDLKPTASHWLHNLLSRIDIRLQSCPSCVVCCGTRTLGLAKPPLDCAPYR